MDTSPEVRCEAAGCTESAIGKVRYGVLNEDIQNPIEAAGPAVFSDKRRLCQRHYEETRKEYVFVRVSPI